MACSVRFTYMYFVFTFILYLYRRTGRQLRIIGLISDRSYPPHYSSQKNPNVRLRILVVQSQTIAKTIFVSSKLTILNRPNLMN